VSVAVQPDEFEEDFDEPFFAKACDAVRSLGKGPLRLSLGTDYSGEMGWR